MIAAQARASDSGTSRGTEAGDHSTIETLFDAAVVLGDAVRGRLGPHLAARYGGQLSIPLRKGRPTVVANFVQTVDGVVALDTTGATGGGEISGFDADDRFVMGLLRALADVVLVGAGTFRASRRGVWNAASIFPREAGAYERLRRDVDLAPHPTTLVVTASGDLARNHPAFAESAVPVVIAGPSAAIERLARAGLPGHVRLERLPGQAPVADELLVLVSRLGAGLVLSEAGPHLTAELFGSGVIDELFLTVSPQLAGRASLVPRLGLVEGRALWPHDSRWSSLVSVRRAGDHLFLRYRFEERIHEH